MRKEGRYGCVRPKTPLGICKMGVGVLGVVLCLFGFVIPCLSFDKGVDIAKRSVDGVALESTTIDTLTDIIGRPSLVKSKKFDNGGRSERLNYYDRGLSFYFEIDTNNKVSLVLCDIYLAKMQDRDSKEFFVPYRHKISKDVNGDWKVKHVLSEFQEYTFVDNNKPLIASLIGYYIQALFEEGGWVSFYYEPVTAFIQKIGLAAKSKL